MLQAGRGEAAALDLLVFNVYALGAGEKRLPESPGAPAVRETGDICLCFLLQSALRGANVTVLGCLNHGVPLFIPENATLRCESGKSLLLLSSKANIWDKPKLHFLLKYLLLLQNRWPGSSSLLTRRLISPK